MMDSLHFGNIFITLVLTLISGCNAEGENRPKRILLDDDYYTIVGKLDNVSKEVETLKSENALLKQQVQDLQAVKRVAFKATITTSITSAQKQIIVFDHVELNIGNAYSVLHGNFIAPVNGTYLFSIYACSYQSHIIILHLMRNGSIVDHLLAGDQNYHECSSNTFILELSKGDDVYVSEGKGAYYLYANEAYGYPHFSGVLLNTN